MYTIRYFVKREIHMLFRDRQDAGKKLIPALKKYHKAHGTIVIGLPRGGVVTAFEVASALNLPLDVVFPRKVGAPGQKELALGAVTETGSGVFNKDLITRIGVSEEYLKKEIASEIAVAQKRLETYRKVCPKIPLQGKTVIIVDDGLATGATMKAAIQSVKKEGVQRIIVAVPVSPPDTAAEIAPTVDEFIALDTPMFFQAVGQFYTNFVGTEDEEVIALLKKAQNTLH